MSGVSDKKVRKEELSDLFKNVFIGVLLLIILSLMSIILINGLPMFNVLGDGNLFGLSDSFWGSLSGALIAGLTAIWISQREHDRQVKEKKEEVNKILLNLNENAEELYVEIKIVNEINQKIREVPNPYSDITSYVDDEGHEHHQNFPPEFLIDEYNDAVAPLKKKLMKSYNHILDLLEEIKIIQIRELDLESYKKILTFKQKSRKIIEPSLNYNIQMKKGFTDSKELEEIEEVISDFYKSVI